MNFLDSFSSNAGPLKVFAWPTLISHLYLLSPCPGIPSLKYSRDYQIRVSHKYSTLYTLMYSQQSETNNTSTTADHMIVEKSI